MGVVASAALCAVVLALVGGFVGVLSGTSAWRPVVEWSDWRRPPRHHVRPRPGPSAPALVVR